ncbi:DUF1749-domain-containing protein [Aspergillus cavernicola]|uniref:DUF1749-domain-containing protein n=1 Tax=Aspergillus cavernicola TaxID=176166 RepID=A0ABR4HAF9_9EURO
MHVRIQSTATPKTPCPGILHEYAERLVAFEYSSSTNHTKPHTLLFIAGLGDGLGTVDYLTDIVAALEDTEWSVFSPILSSAYGGWGMSGLGKDIDEIAQCVQYIERYKHASIADTAAGPGKIVIMGHSTGSQDVMQYISAPNPRHPHSRPKLDRAPPIVRPQVDGAIMQAPVSDRQAIQSVLKEGSDRHSPEDMQKIYDDAVARARRHTFEEYDGLDTIIPLPVTASIGYPETTAVSSRRFLSLASPDSPGAPGEDDLFSSDLGDERLKKTFGMVHGRGVLRSSLLVLYSGKDHSVPPWVEKGVLLWRWRRVTDSERVYWHDQSGIIPGASHTLSGPHQVEQRRVLVHKVTRFLSDIELPPE